MTSHLPKVWPSSGTLEQQRKSILYMLENLGINTSDAPEGNEDLLLYVAAKESELNAKNTSYGAKIIL